MRKLKSIILLSVLISMATLFTACSSEPFSKAEIVEVFYTLDDLSTTEYRYLTRDTNLKFGYNYTLVFTYKNPDLNVERALFYIDGKKANTEYLLSGPKIKQSEIMCVSFPECGFALPDNYNDESYNLKLTVELVDKKGRKSVPYSWDVAVQGQFE